MWSPWQVALCAGVAAGFVSVFPSLGRGTFAVIVFAAVISIYIFLATWLGARVSKRTLLPSKSALALVVAFAIVVVFASIPIGTHAVVYSAEIEGAQSVFRHRFYVFCAVISIVPGIATFAFFRTFGSWPNTSMERTRER